jgi:uncharacterized membrane protein YtjA (UPF0391 family)
MPVWAVTFLVIGLLATTFAYSAMGGSLSGVALVLGAVFTSLALITMLMDLL